MVNVPSISTSAGEPLQPRTPLWKGVDVALISAGTVLFMVLGGIGVALVFGASANVPGANAGIGGRLTVEFTLAVLALEFVAILLAVWLLGLLRRKYSWATIGLVPTTRKWVAAAVGLFVVLRIVVVLMALLLAALGMTSGQAQALAPQGFSWVGAIGNVLLAGILVPIAEEIFFRGVVYRWLRDRWGVAVGVIVSGIVFGLVHFEPATVIPAILLGCALALVYERSKSLWPSILIHMLNNLSAVVLLYVLLGLGVQMPK